jgi:hypothetical protein
VRRVFRGQYWCDDFLRVGSDFVVTVRGQLPRTPEDLFQGVRIADLAAYDVRYVSQRKGVHGLMS